MFSPVIAKGGFKFIEQYSIDVLNIQVQYYQHEKTGAKHYHFACDDNNKTFMIALRTLPMNSSGVAHILEHLVLCGSSRYPVRDPFFLMLRRSLSNFMNAFTAPDWTAYPFATQNEKDFDNLLQVYLDAVFFPNLEDLDFKQEGWRLHIDDVGEDAKLQYKGVVFNEMKGAMSSPTRQLWHYVCRHLFSNSTYHHNSGGEPLDIPSLTHKELLDFHQCYYHPSNVVFFSYGDLEPAQLQEKIEVLVLYAFEKKDNIPTLDNDLRFQTPKTKVEYYPVASDAQQDEQEKNNQTHIVLAWLLDFNSLDIDDLLEANLLNLLLFDNASSPMQKLLESSSLGNAPSPINGLEDEMKEMVFVIGLEGCDANTDKQVEELIMNELQRLSKEGIDAEKVAACMHQLELAQRDVSGGGMPTGLNLLLSVTSPAIHNTAIGSHLDIDTPLKKLREKSENPQFIKSLMNKLLENTHRLTLKMCPDSTLNAKNLAQEQQQLAQWKQQLSLQEQKQIQDEGKELARRQLQPQDSTLLPTITVADIKNECEFMQATEKKENYSYYQTRCNGLVYVNGVVSLPSLSQQQSCLLPLLSAILNQVGTGDKSYLQVQQDCARYSGGIAIKPHIWQPIKSAKQDTKSTENLCLRMVVSSMSLHDNSEQLFALMQNSIYSPRFDEKAHIKEVINQLASSAYYSIAGSGHILAMQAAAGYFSTLSNISLEWSGLSAVYRLLELKKSLHKDELYENFINEIKQLYKLISQQWQTQWLLLSDEKNKTDLLRAYKQKVATMNNTNTEDVLFDCTTLANQKSVWSIESEVNYCASAYAVVGITHVDSAPLYILANYLRNVYLHTAIREQGGAYGGGCQYDYLSATFRFFSYRDPRLQETFADFTLAIEKTVTQKIKLQDVQEAIFNAIAKFDAPASPPDTVKQDFYASLKGIDKDFRENYKQRLLNVTADDIVRVAKKYLRNQQHSLAVITGHQQAQELSQSEGYYHTAIKL